MDIPLRGSKTMKIVALAGGVGGAKLVDGLAQVSQSEDLTVIVNTGDDFDHLGLRICPDLDTVMYTLAGVANPETGWGRRDDTWNALETLRQLGGPDWFRLGDRDLALSLVRTRGLGAGEPLSRIIERLGRHLGVDVRVLPMTDDSVPTIVLTDRGELPFQEYFVALACEPEVRGFRFEGIQRARPAPGVIPSLAEADLVVLCPSNPWVSLDPILAVPGISEAFRGKVIVGVSPIIGGSAIKGPAAKMFRELGIEPSALAVAEHYRDRMSGLVIDIKDATLAPSIRSLGLDVLAAQTVMRDRTDRRKLAAQLLEFAVKIMLQPEQNL
jgi:LPPG:FO 2-phospho-L-lactate transferase